MRKARILWADDEIDLLKPHILFLEQRGYEVTTATNGVDAVEICLEQPFDIVFLDENMPGLTGLETLEHIKKQFPSLPVIMITKNEQENVMEEAIGAKITDYLIKPVNPHQILSTLKKNLEGRILISEKATSGYQSEFGKIGLEINDSLTWDDWIQIYKKLVFWELELEGSDNNMNEILQFQKQEANAAFSKFIKRNYQNWLECDYPSRPLLSPDLVSKRIFPLLDQKEKVALIIIDNFRYDQWKALMPSISPYFNIEQEELYCSILPTATHYARNAIFSGLMPLQISEMFPHLWVGDDSEEGKNQKEAELLQTQIERFRRKDQTTYYKINDNASGERLNQQLPRLLEKDLICLVYNFVDMLSHARTESKMIRELAASESAYRSLALSWFKHSPLILLLQQLSEKGVKVILTTDHGSIRIQNPLKVVGDRNTNSNLRYKVGKNLNYNEKEVLAFSKPHQVQLPAPNVSSTYIFADSDHFFAYPNNYNYYVSYYRDTFQHGGISLEEMLIPLITLTPKSH